ncbi:MAG: VOC family protein [Nocardioidaceae bacterium]
MPRLIFVNLPVADLTKSVDFFTSLGFTFNSQSTDDNATCMVISDQAFVMLLVRPFFATFVTKDLADPAATTGAIVTVSAQSREEVDQLVDRALELGGAKAKEPLDEGFMYGRSFHDLDGHAWEVMWMDPGSGQ